MVDTYPTNNVHNLKGVWYLENQQILLTLSFYVLYIRFQSNLLIF